VLKYKLVLLAEFSGSLLPTYQYNGRRYSIIHGALKPPSGDLLEETS